MRRNECRAAFSYFSNRSPALRGCSSVAQFFGRPKGGNKSFQLNPAAVLDLTSTKTVAHTPAKAKHHMRGSKSCAKNCMSNASDNDRLDLSMQQHHNRLESIYLPDRTYILSSSSGMSPHVKPLA